MASARVARELIRSAFQASNAAAWVGHRSLSGAGDVVHRSQIGVSQVPLFFVGTFQSHNSFAGRPQAHRCRRRDEQTIPRVPSGSVTVSQVIARSVRG